MDSMSDLTLDEDFRLEKIFKLVNDFSKLCVSSIVFVNLNIYSSYLTSLRCISFPVLPMGSSSVSGNGPSIRKSPASLTS